MNTYRALPSEGESLESSARMYAIIAGVTLTAGVCLAGYGAYKWSMASDDMHMTFHAAPKGWRLGPSVLEYTW